jgi:hypothetical protein
MTKKRRSLEHYIQEERERDPYLAALMDATQHAADVDEFDEILAAFPEREEWEQQTTNKTA